MEWNTKLLNQDQLEKELMAHEIMRLRRDCENMYDALKSVRTDILDVYETPEKQLPERIEKLYQKGQSIGVIIGHIERGRKFYSYTSLVTKEGGE